MHHINREQTKNEEMTKQSSLSLLAKEKELSVLQSVCYWSIWSVLSNVID